MGKVNACEPSSLRVVRSDKPKTLTGLSQNGTATGLEAPESSRMGHNVVGAQREPNPIASLVRNVVSPYRSLVSFSATRSGRPVGKS